MSENAYIATSEPASGKRVVVLGLMELAARHFSRLAFFRPVVRERAEDDLSIRLVRDRYQLPGPAEEMAGVTRGEARRWLAEDREDRLLEVILQRYQRLEERADFVLCEGTSFRGLAPGYEFELNAAIAANLGCAVMPVFSARDKAAGDVVGAVRIGLDQLREHRCTVLATCVNQARPDEFEAIRAACRDVARGDEPPVFVLPHEPVLAQPTLREVACSLGAELLLGDEQAMDREIGSVKVAAMQLAHFLSRMSPESLIITPGDRDDILVGSVATALSHHGPSVAGVLLTGGLRPEESVMRLVGGIPAAPILAVDSDTFTTALGVSKIRPQLSPETPRKIASALGLFERHVDLEELGRRLQTPTARHMTPLRFEYELIRRARLDRKRIVLPEGEEPRILEAVDALRRRDVAELLLLGAEDKVRAAAAAQGVSLDGVSVVDPQTSPDRDAFADLYHQLRRHKGINLDAARDRMQDVNYFGTMMVHCGRADAMVSGAVHTTAHTIRPAFEIIKTAPGVSVVSSVFLMCLPDRVLVYGDCAVNPNPTAEQLAEIATSSAETAATFGIEPRVAMLSYSTGESGGGEDVRRVLEATRLARQRRPDLPIDGPLQYDAAVDEQVARTKLPGSTVAGRATVFVFPDLNTGNNTYKAVQRSAGAIAIGPVLQGLRRPVNDLSRGCTVPDIVNTVAISAIQAQATTAD